MTILRRIDQWDTPASWTPEECLRELLHEIDAGTLDPQHLVVIFRQRNLSPGFRVAGPGSQYEKIGMVQSWLHNYLQAVEGS